MAEPRLTLRVLGRWSPYAPAGGACPAYLVEAEGTRILVECGCGTLANLHRYCTGFDLTAAAITHLHPDHFSDIYALQAELSFGRYPQPAAPPLLLYAPADASTHLPECLPMESRKDFVERFAFKALETGRGQVGPIELRFVRTSHPQLCFAIEFRYRERRLVYTADTGPSTAVEQLAAGADLFLCESTLHEEDADLAVRLGHLTGSMAGALARRAGVRRFLLTHFTATRPAFKESVAAAAKEFADVRAAEEGALYEV